jgi:adenylyltransferase/sulfurtransferase
MERYAKQLLLKEIGENGQAKLAKARVLVIGTGGLGSPALYYLAAAGVGNIGIADFDVVALSNLNRQILFGESDLGKSKIQIAKEKILNLNSKINIEIFEAKIDSQNIRDIITNYDIVADCTDNFTTRFVINRGCYENNKPLVIAAVNGFSGMLLSVIAPVSACLECFYKGISKNALDNAAYFGILGAHAGTMGSLQAVEIIKHILGSGNLLVNKVLLINHIESEYRIREFTKNPSCPVCANQNR